ncbi:MAG: flagellar export chaperone FliS [Peptococcaceae bacterium]|nr:flagellar export chaperone FliS [Peptococcaceae bacterium]
MAIGNPYAQYQQNAVHTATPEELAMMLYNGLVKNIKQSMFSLEKNDITTTHNNLVRAQEIVLYLNGSLDENNELSKNLESLYDYMYRRLMEANAKKDREIIREMLEMAEGFRDTWQQAMKKASLGD